MGEDANCQKQCSVILNKKDVDDFKWIIERGYSVNL